MNAHRHDLNAIVAAVTPGSKVLDLGCGDGALLARLVTEKQVVARGIELNEAAVRACIARGLSVRQGNIEEGLADYPDAAFDTVVLSQTLALLNRPEPVVREMLRVGTRAVISFDNAGHWRKRLRMLRGAGFGPELASGEMRERAITLVHFAAFAQRMGARVERSDYVGRIQIWPELFGSVAIATLVCADG